MIVDKPADFLAKLETETFPATGPVCAKAVMLVEPAEFTVNTESAIDNHYMNLTDLADSQRALEQARALAGLITRQGIDVVSFPGRRETPDAVFPNNVFATTPDRFIIGRMLRPSRQREADRPDIRAYFTTRGYREIDLSGEDMVAELTGTLIIDHARGIGFCGMTGRVDQAGLRAMHEAFDLKLTFSFDLRPEEYHTNVIMMVLAGRACVIYPGGFADPAVPAAIARAFPGRTLVLNTAEQCAFAANCIALTEKDLFMSQTAFDALRDSSRRTLEDWGFTIHSTPLDEIEKAGGSLRCMVAEIF
ncbi:MAG TPA: arginine deiminase-related protein [Xanthomonadales bacterium]